jgi:hypothetical protein
MNRPPSVENPDVAAQHEWRCACAVRPLLGIHSDGLMVHAQVSGRRDYPLHYVWDLLEAAAVAHCPACHTWRRLVYDRATGAVYDEQLPQTRPLRVWCICNPEHPKYRGRDQTAVPGRNGATYDKR